MGRVVSVNVGLPADVAWRGKVVRTAIWKHPVNQRVMVRHLNIDGDAQGDPQSHGGVHRAVMVYQLASYRYWEQVLHRTLSEYGMFGENLTVEGLADDQVCVGDRYRIGSALLEVSQPRVTCYRVGIRMDEPRMPALLVSHRRPGFYLRVIEEGEIGAGDEIIRTEQGREGLTVAEVDALLYLPEHPADRIRRAASEPSLGPGWRRSFEALLANTSGSPGNAGLTPVLAAVAWQGFRMLKVVKVVKESDSVKSLLLTANEPPYLSPPAAGSFVVMRLPGAVGGGVVTRSYSISNLGQGGMYRVSVKLGSGDGSRYIHSSVRAGDLIEVSAPRGIFTLRDDKKPVALLSAGIGITPVLGMLHQLVADQTIDRDVYWIYGARNGAEHPFASEVRHLLDALPRVHVLVAYSQPRAEDRLGRDFDVSERISVATVQRLGIPITAQFYLCGPSSFIADLVTGLKDMGVTSATIHTEIFGSVASITPGIVAGPARSPHVPEGPQGDGPIVRFSRSGLAIPWSEKFQNVLEFAEACDIPVRWACRTGVCHTCETALIGGHISYDPQPIDAPVNGNVLICCARPTTDIEIDL
ncbi:MOSC domain-containing protein [Dyella monticola]|uniref:MOSC domain-containing protein n=1 Tax=Dyella monticola TaxID=1927958 RepID=A0A370X5H6_9GAMM|nr:MOSC and FAD-binding oxidoreductase domain-containing protein [Dyella monticola]RDS83530.1 MOSC domain-containing protein [Dyella monticola]